MPYGLAEAVSHDLFVAALIRAVRRGATDIGGAGFYDFPAMLHGAPQTRNVTPLSWSTTVADHSTLRLILAWSCDSGGDEAALRRTAVG
jgi:hypothetical protein